jgi:glycosyltransferase involved in cell wall biosynthesis
MTVSVVIPTYNRPQQLKTAIDSAATQTHPPTEIIISDQAVNPETARVVEQAQETHPVPIRYIRQTRPVSPERNWITGIKAAETKWVKIVPDDDSLEPTCLEKQLALSDGKCLVQSAAHVNGNVWYGQTIPAANQLATMVHNGLASANPVTCLNDLETVFKGLSFIRRLSWPTYKSGCGANLLLMYAGILHDWSLYANTAEPLCTIGGFNGDGNDRSYTLRLMENNPGLWQSAYNESYTLLNELAGSV